MKKETFRPNGLSRDRLGGPPTGVTAFDVIQKKKQNTKPESGQPSRPNCRITGRVRVEEQTTPPRGELQNPPVSTENGKSSVS